MPLGIEVGLGPGDFALDGEPALPPSKGGEAPYFSAHVYCGQTAVWISTALGMEVGLGLGHIVLDGAQLSPQKERQTAGWIKMPLGMELGLVPGDIVLDGYPAPLP